MDPKYPYFIVPAVEAYKTLDPESEEAQKIAAFLSVNIGDKEALSAILGVSMEEAPSSKTAASESSFATIDSFLDKFSDSKPLGYMAQMSEEPAQAPQESEEVTGLKVLLKEHRYREAIEFIEAQNLNYPQKSIYFAHQMRFIKKLMALDSKNALKNQQ